MREIINRLMESHHTISEKSWTNREPGDHAYDTLVKDIDNLITQVSSIESYVKSHTEKELSDKEITEYLRHIRDAVHIIGTLNTPERYHR